MKPTTGPMTKKMMVSCQDVQIMRQRSPMTVVASRTMVTMASLAVSFTCSAS